MIPRRIVPDIPLQEFLNIIQFTVIPEIKPLHQPLPIRPDVIVFRILLKHLFDKLRLPCRVIELIDYQLPMVPYLVILFVAESFRVEEFDFLAEVSVQGKDHFGAIEPIKSELKRRNEIPIELPDGIMCGVHLGDVFSDLESSLAVLLLCSYSA
jgi:hypothetical protein